MTIYTAYSTREAAEEMASIYENAGNRSEIIIGFNAHGDIDYGYRGVTTCPDIEVKTDSSTLDIALECEDEWTEKDRKNVIDAFEWVLDEYGFDIVFSSGDEEVDLETDLEDLETIIVLRDNAKDLKFSGKKIAEVSSTDNSACSNYSGSTGRWSELALYRTSSGKFICEQIDYTRWQGERTRYNGAVCDNEDEVIAFFGTDRLAKSLYESSGIACDEAHTPTL